MYFLVKMVLLFFGDMQFLGALGEVNQTQILLKRFESNLAIPFD